jgi:hypothetical protein
MRWLNRDLVGEKGGVSLYGFSLPKPTKTVYTVLRQLVQWIPPGMIQ